MEVRGEGGGAKVSATHSMFSRTIARRSSASASVPPVEGLVEGVDLRFAVDAVGAPVALRALRLNRARQHFRAFAVELRPLGHSALLVGNPYEIESDTCDTSGTKE